ncbi:MAG: DUF1501 domain-containing protein [Leeuwenhoekiella sp.]
MIKGGLSTKMYVVTLRGFDTHANQASTHNARMKELSTGIKNFYDDLKATKDDKRVLSMTFSEFGRRLEENGSKGTDHGAASTTLLFGPGLDGHGFVGKHPDLNKTDKTGNLKNTTDFRDLYATLLKEWLCVDSNTVDSLFPSYKNSTLPLGFECTSATKSSALLSSDNFGSNLDSFYQVATYNADQTYIEFRLPVAAKVTIKLYNIVGQEVATLSNDFLYEGVHKINVKETATIDLAGGEFIYVMQTGGKQYSRPILVK